MSKPIIEIKGLSAGYDGRTVLHDVNLTVGERDFLGIIGPNGGGKTTLIKCILGLLKPSAGQVLFHPANGGGRLSVGYLPQYSGIDRKFPITVEQVVLSGLGGAKGLVSGFSQAQREQARQVIGQMGLDGLEERAIGTLSGGQLQRVLLGRAVVSQPEAVVLDEPGTYMDRHSEARLYELLAHINRRCAVILVSHDIGTVVRRAGAVACVDGTLHYYTDTREAEKWMTGDFLKTP